MTGIRRDYGATVLHSRGGDPAPLTEVPDVVLTILRYNYVDTLVELLLTKDVHLGPAEFLPAPRTEEVLAQDESGQYTVPTGKYTQGFGWRAVGVDLEPGDGLSLVKAEMRNLWRERISG